ncbi:unnamed protein product [marine sediment metagenome]|uniref:Uncharacterized protein n=1 Tax=marine sediment metagenome TaxID=412755 RepID=X1SI97_9ZZZZ
MNKFEKLQAIINLADEAQQLVDDRDCESLPGILEDILQTTDLLLELIR